MGAATDFFSSPDLTLAPGGDAHGSTDFGTHDDSGNGFNISDSLATGLSWFNKLVDTGSNVANAVQTYQQRDAIASAQNTAANLRNQVGNQPGITNETMKLLIYGMIALVAGLFLWSVFRPSR